MRRHLIDSGWVALLAGLLAMLAVGGLRWPPAIAVALYLAACAALALLVCRRLTHHPGGWGRSAAIVGVGLALRTLFLLHPASDDVHRYLWEGQVQRAGHNPYLVSPAMLRHHYAGDPLYEGINHPDFPAIYGPVMLLLARAVAAAMAPLDLPLAQQLLGWKLLLLLAELATLLLLAAMLRTANRHPAWLALYAWHPLVLVYGIGAGHLDLLQNLLLALAGGALLAGPARPVIGYLAAGAAVGLKHVAVILLPWLVQRRHLSYAPLVLLPCASILVFWENGLFASLTRFAGELHSGDLVPRLWRLLLPEVWAIRAALACLLAGLVLIWLFLQDHPRAALGWAWLWLLACLPTVHAWYFLPLALFAVGHPHPVWLTALAAAGAQLWLRHAQAATGAWQEPAWLVWACWAPPLVTLLAAALRRTPLPGARQFAPPASLDIVIPTLNEAERLEHTLAALALAQEQLRLAEPTMRVRTIVADAGSTDGTTAVAAAAGADVLGGLPPGRGQQLAAGVAAGTGDLVLLLHADAVPDPAALCSLVAQLRAQPGSAWGILGHRYDQRPPKLRLIELSNRLRFNLAGIAFGDQGMFLRRAALVAIGGIPALPLMEDVELSLRLAPWPRLWLAGNSLTVSARRWQRRGFPGYTFQVLCLVTWYLVARRLGMAQKKLAGRLYQRYYGRPAS